MLSEFLKGLNIYHQLTKFNLPVVGPTRNVSNIMPNYHLFNNQGHMGVVLNVLGNYYLTGLITTKPPRFVPNGCVKSLNLLTANGDPQFLVLNLMDKSIWEASNYPINNVVAQVDSLAMSKDILTVLDQSEKQHQVLSFLVYTKLSSSKPSYGNVISEVQRVQKDIDLITRPSQPLQKITVYPANGRIYCSVSNVYDPFWYYKLTFLNSLPLDDQKPLLAHLDSDLALSKWSEVVDSKFE